MDDNICKKYNIPDDISQTLDDIDYFCRLLRKNAVQDSKNAFAKLPILVQCLFLTNARKILANKDDYTDDSYLTAFRVFKLFRSTEDKEKIIFEPYKGEVESDYKKAFDWNKNYSETKTPGIEIVDYSEKSVAVFGDTKSIKEELKAIGGKFNIGLKRGEVKQPGWIFAKTKRAQIEAVLSPISTPRRSDSPASTPKKPVKSPASPRSKSPASPRSRKTYDKEFQKHDEPEEGGPLYLFYTSLYEEKPSSRLAITWLTEYGVYDGKERSALVDKYKTLADKGKLIKLR